MDRGEIEAVLGFGIHGSGEEQEEQKNQKKSEQHKQEDNPLYTSIPP